MVHILGVIVGVVILSGISALEASVAHTIYRWKLAHLYPGLTFSDVLFFNLAISCLMRSSQFVRIKGEDYEIHWPSFASFAFAPLLVLCAAWLFILIGA